MNYRALGATGLRVSEIGFGTWGLGGDSGGAISYGPTSDDTSRAALRCAHEQGINFFDTSDLYGFGHSERLLGEAFAGRREEVVIASKGGFADAQRQDFSAAHLQGALEKSLRRLRTDYIDLYQLHSPPIALLREQRETLELLQKLLIAGKIRSWGVSARSPEEARIAVEEFNAPCVQVNFNLTDQRVARNGLLELCHLRGTGVIVRTPLCFGFLAGRHSPPEGFGPSDHRSRWPAKQIQRWQQAKDVFEFLFSANPDDTPAQLALRFCLSFRAVSTTIPGMLTEAQVRENAAASSTGSLPPDQVEQALAVGDTTEFFVGRD
jgi:aryl-alcohol dehydrogenase-like predicted oxidoreductase